jgi:hypothetical protein
VSELPSPGRPDRRGIGARRRLRGNPASAIYGTIVTAGLIAARGSHEARPWPLVLAVVATLLVFWVTHAYTDTIGGLITAGKADPAARPSLLHALREEAPILESGLFPIVVMLISHAFGASVGNAATIAVAAAALELFGWSALAARRAELETKERVVFVLVTGLLGAALIVLKTLIH